MKNILYFLLFIGLFLSPACDEITPDISEPTGGTGGNNNNLEDQKRQVLIEEFTGVKCVNCPEGSEQIENMLSIYGDQLIAVSIHAGFFAPPHDNSLYDFRTSDGDAILDYVGQPIGFPTAVVNRKIFTGENDLQVFQDTWNGHVTTEISLDPLVKIGIDPTFNENSRQLDIDLIILPVETISNENLRYTVMITENNIMDYQTVPELSDPQPDYIHKHVFRDVLTANFDGDPITEAIIPNIAIEKSLSYTLPSEWNAANCEIIAFVNYSGATKEILQAAEAHVVE